MSNNANDEWNVERWNRNLDQPAGEPEVVGDWNPDDVVSVLVVDDMVCPTCFSERIIANWKNPRVMCCIDCGKIFNYG